MAAPHRPFKDGPPKLRRQPTDKADLPAGVAPLAAVREKIVCRTAGTRADLKELISRHAGCAENIAIEPAQIDERLSFLDRDARRRQPAPSFHQRCRDIVLHFVAARSDGRTQRDFDVHWGYTVTFLKETNRLLSNSRQRAAPPGMHGRGQSLTRCNKQERNAIRRENAEEDIGFSRHHAVCFTGLFELLVSDFNNTVAVHLAHGHDPAIVNSDGEFHVANILADDLWIVPDSIGNIQPRVGPDALPPAPADEAMEQTLVVRPLRNFKIGHVHASVIIMTSSERCKPVRFDAFQRPQNGNSLAIFSGLAKKYQWRSFEEQSFKTKGVGGVTRGLSQFDPRLLMCSQLELTNRFKGLILLPTVIDLCLTVFLLGIGCGPSTGMNPFQPLQISTMPGESRAIGMNIFAAEHKN